MGWTKRQVAEQIISAINAFDDTVGSNINPRQVEGMLAGLRQDAILAKYNGSRYLAAARRINGDWVQKFELTIDPTIQDVNAEYLLVDCPKAVSINENRSGFVYVGRQKKTNKFFMAQSRDEIATLKARGFINNGKTIVAMYSDNQLEIYGDKSLQKVYLEAILQFPEDKPNFDEEFDDYPVSADLITGLVS